MEKKPIFRVKNEVFIMEFIELLKQLMNDGVITIERHNIANTNNVIRDALLIKYSDSAVAPTVYLDELQELYEDGYSMAYLVQMTIDMLKEQRINMPEIPELTAEVAKRNMYCVLVNAAENAEMLKTVPHEMYEDLAIVARFKVGEDGSFAVTDYICQSLKMTSEEVFEFAHANTDAQRFTCESMIDTMRNIMLNDGVPEDFIEELLNVSGKDCPMWILTNESQIDGAVAITSKKVLAEAHIKLGEDFYILPSSRHEVILVPKSCIADVKDLERMVIEVNATEVSKVDKLSDSVYQYDGRKVSRVDCQVRDEMETLKTEMSKSHMHCH